MHNLIVTPAQFGRQRTHFFVGEDVDMSAPATALCGRVVSFDFDSLPPSVRSSGPLASSYATSSALTMALEDKRLGDTHILGVCRRCAAKYRAAHDL